MTNSERNATIEHLKLQIRENQIMLAELTRSYDMAGGVSPDDDRWVWIRTISGDRVEAVWHPDEQAWRSFDGTHYLKQHVNRWWEKPIPMDDLMLAYEMQSWKEDWHD